jgi:hypothetical protein
MASFPDDLERPSQYAEPGLNPVSQLLASDAGDYVADEIVQRASAAAAEDTANAASYLPQSLGDALTLAADADTPVALYFRDTRAYWRVVDEDARRTDADINANDGAFAVPVPPTPVYVGNDGASQPAIPTATPSGLPQPGTISLAYPPNIPVTPLKDDDE